MPHIPKLSGGGSGAVFHRVFIGGKENLAEFKQLWDIFFALIAHHLGDSLFHRNIGGFALDDGKGDAVEKEDKIWSCVVFLVSAVHGKFLCHMKQVVAWVFPIDVIHVEAEKPPLAYRLGVATP